MLLSDTTTYDSILNMDIERGVITNKCTAHKRFGGRNPEELTFKINDFDYNSHSDMAQYDKYAIGINSNHIMRFDLNTGKIAHQKAYERNPHFSAVATDTNGNVIVGSSNGSIRIFSDVGKKAVKCWAGLGDAISNLDVSAEGNIVYTANNYFVYIPLFYSEDSEQCYTGKLGQEVITYLNLVGQDMHNAQFSPDGKTIIFSMGKFLFEWKISHLVAKEKEFVVYEADKPIIQHKFSNGKFALIDHKPIRFIETASDTA